MPATRSPSRPASASITMKKDGTITIKGKDITIERQRARSTSRRRATWSSRAARWGSTERRGRVMKAPDELTLTCCSWRRPTEVAALLGRPTPAPASAPAPSLPQAVTARLHGFGLDERPLVAGVPAFPAKSSPPGPSCRSVSRQIERRRRVGVRERRRAAPHHRRRAAGPGSCDRRTRKRSPTRCPSRPTATASW